MIAVLCRACADRAISSNQPVRVRTSEHVLTLCCSASGLERSNREDEGGAERSAAAHGDRGGAPFDGISSMTLAASPCLFSLVSCKRTTGPLARAACASSSCPCSHTSSVSARRACCSRPPWPRPPPHCARSAGPSPRPHRASSFSRSAFPWTAPLRLRSLPMASLPACMLSWSALPLPSLQAASMRLAIPAMATQAIRPYRLRAGR